MIFSVIAATKLLMARLCGLGNFRRARCGGIRIAADALPWFSPLR
jgi:hypothetical protein